MSDSTGSGDIVDERTAGSTELVVEADTGRQAQKTLQDAFFDAGKGPGAVAFVGQDVLTGPKDRLDPLTDRGQVHVVSGLPDAAGTHDRGIHLANGVGELAPSVAFVGKEDLASGPRASGKQLQAHLAFVTFGRGERQRTRRAVGGKDRMCQGRSKSRPFSPVEKWATFGDATGACVLSRRRARQAPVGTSHRGCIGPHAVAGSRCAGRANESLGDLFDPGGGSGVDVPAAQPVAIAF